MKKKIVDIVNFNADASCLSSADWLKYLSGGKNSIFFQWLSLYVHYKKKLVLGFPGATIADIKTFNPEAIELINQNTDIFEIIPRPFAHDIGLLRSSEAFIWNVKAGSSPALVLLKILLIITCLQNLCVTLDISQIYKN